MGRSPKRSLQLPTEEIKNSKISKSITRLSLTSHHRQWNGVKCREEINMSNLGGRAASEIWSVVGRPTSVRS